MRIVQLSETPYRLGCPATLEGNVGTLEVHLERRTVQFVGGVPREAGERHDVSRDPLRSRDFWRFIERFKHLFPLIRACRAECDTCHKLRTITVFGLDGVCLVCNPQRIVNCAACGARVCQDRRTGSVGCIVCEPVRIRPGIESGFQDEPVVRRRRGRPRKES